MSQKWFTALKKVHGYEPIAECSRYIQGQDVWKLCHFFVICSLTTWDTHPSTTGQSWSCECPCWQKMNWSSFCWILVGNCWLTLVNWSPGTTLLPRGQCYNYCTVPKLPTSPNTTTNTVPKLELLIPINLISVFLKTELFVEWNWQMWAKVK